MSDSAYMLESGRRCILRARPLPLLRTYHVLFFPTEQGRCGERDEHEMFSLAHSLARDLGRRYHGDAGCYAIVFSGGGTRRRPWPHFHIVAVRGLWSKRRALLLLHIKQLLIRVGRIEEALHGQVRAGA